MLRVSKTVFSLARIGSVKKLTFGADLVCVVVVSYQDHSHSHTDRKAGEGRPSPTEPRHTETRKHTETQHDGPDSHTLSDEEGRPLEKAPSVSPLPLPAAFVTPAAASRSPDVEPSSLQLGSRYVEIL